MSATVLSETDSPLRVKPASGSPADRPRTDDRSAVPSQYTELCPIRYSGAGPAQGCGRRDSALRRVRAPTERPISASSAAACTAVPSTSVRAALGAGVARGAVALALGFVAVDWALGFVAVDWALGFVAVDWALGFAAVDWALGFA